MKRHTSLFIQLSIRTRFFIIIFSRIRQAIHRSVSKGIAYNNSSRIQSLVKANTARKCSFSLLDNFQLFAVLSNPLQIMLFETRCILHKRNFLINLK